MKTKRELSLVLGLGFVVASALSMAPTASVFADGDEPILIGDGDSLYAAFYYGGNYKLANDIDYSSQYSSAIFAMADTVLDLNGHTLTFDGDAEYLVNYGGDVTIKGEGKIKKTVDSTGNPAIWAYYGNTVTLEEGVIEAVDYAVVVATNSDYSTAGGTFVMNGGNVVSNGYGIVAYYDGRVEINGGAIDAGTFAITGNGVAKNAGATFEINGGTLTSESDYAIYVPQVDGVVTINGGSITGKAGAIAANRGDITITDGDLKSLGTAEMSGDVAQDGTRGYGNAVIGIAKEYGPVGLTISGGNFVAEGDAAMIADPSGLDNENAATVAISGGTFNVRPEDEQIANGYDVYDTDAGFVVDETVSPLIIDEAILLPGEVYSINLGESGRYARVITDNSGLYTLDGTTITAGDTTGEASYKVNYGGLIHPQETTYALAVIDAEDIELVADEGTDLDEAVVSEVAEKIKDIVEGRTYETETLDLPWFSADGMVWANPDMVRAAVANGETLKIKMYSAQVDLDNLSEEDWADLEGMIEEDDTVVGIWDVELVIENENGEEVGGVVQLETPIQLAFAVPEGLRVAEDGYTRKFFITRYHLGRVSLSEEIDRFAATFDGENAGMDNDKFSAFILTYQDEKNVEAPETGRFTEALGAAKKGGKVGVFVLALGMMMLGFGLVSLGHQYQTREKNIKD